MRYFVLRSKTLLIFLSYLSEASAETQAVRNGPAARQTAPVHDGVQQLGGGKALAFHVLVDRRNGRLIQVCNVQTIEARQRKILADAVAASVDRLGCAQCDQIARAEESRRAVARYSSTSASAHSARKSV